MSRAAAARTLPPRLVLASASPRRREILSTLGLTFEVVALDVDETRHPGERAEAYARSRGGRFPNPQYCPT